MRVVRMKDELHSALEMLTDDSHLAEELRPHLAALRLWLDSWIVPNIKSVYEELKTEHESRRSKSRRSHGSF